MVCQPGCKSTNLRKRAKAVRRNVLDLHALALKVDEIVTLRRREGLREREEVQRNGQCHFGESADFKASDAEQNAVRKAFLKELEGKFLATHPSSKDEDQISGVRGVAQGKPGM